MSRPRTFTVPAEQLDNWLGFRDALIASTRQKVDFNAAGKCERELREVLARYPVHDSVCAVLLLINGIGKAVRKAGKEE